MQTLRLFERAHNVEVKQPDVPPPHSMYTHTHTCTAHVHAHTQTPLLPLSGGTNACKYRLSLQPWRIWTRSCVRPEARHNFTTLQHYTPCILTVTILVLTDITDMNITQTNSLGDVKQ